MPSPERIMCTDRCSIQKYDGSPIPENLIKEDVTEKKVSSAFRVITNDWDKVGFRPVITIGREI